MHRLRALALLAPLLLLTGCVSEAEQACLDARAVVEAQYRTLGAAVAVALLLALSVGHLVRHPVRPVSAVRAVGAVLLFLPALGAGGLLGLLLGQVAGAYSRTCTTDDGIFSDDLTTFVVVVLAVLTTALLSVTVGLCALAWSLWRSGRSVRLDGAT